jgi:hypothetical protein
MLFCKDCHWWGVTNDPDFFYQGPGEDRGLKPCGSKKNGLNASDAMNSYEEIAPALTSVAFTG